MLRVHLQILFVWGVAAQLKYCLDDPYVTYANGIALNQILDHPTNPDWFLILSDSNTTLVDVKNSWTVVQSNNVSAITGTWLQEGDYIVEADATTISIVSASDLSVLSSTSIDAQWGNIWRLVPNPSEKLLFVQTDGLKIAAYNITALDLVFVRIYDISSTQAFVGFLTNTLACNEQTIYVAATNGLFGVDIASGSVTQYSSSYASEVVISNDGSLLLESSSEGTRVRNAKNATQLFNIYSSSYPMRRIQSTHKILFLSGTSSVTISQVNFTDPVSPLISYTGPLMGTSTSQWSSPVFVSVNVNLNMTRIMVTWRFGQSGISRIYLFRSCGEYPPSSSIASTSTSTLASSTFQVEPQVESSKNLTAPIVGGVIGGIALLMLIAITMACIYLRNKKRPFLFQEDSEVILAPREKDRWAIDYSEIKIQHKLGEGSFGIVFYAEWRSGPCVVKQLKSVSTEESISFLKEMNSMKNLRPHPNVCKLLGVCTDPEHPLCIVIEYLSEGALLENIYHNKIKMNQRMVMNMARDVASGMGHLHSENIMHCDLAARNLMISAAGNSFVVKIADFGLSQSSATVKTDQEHHIPVRWTSPEVLAGGNFTKANDVWAFGVTLWEMCETTRPYYHLMNKDVADGVMNGTLRLEKPNAVPICDEFWEIMRLCWLPELQRPTFDEIVPMIEKVIQDQGDVEEVEEVSIVIEKGNGHLYASSPSNLYEKTPQLNQT